MAARSRNNNLKNPTLLIRSIPVPDPGGGFVEPDPARFSRNADEFYSLRNPSTDRHCRILAYLTDFYDIALTAFGSSGSGQVDPARAVELLEDILGLQEDNFVAFRARARQFAQKRIQPSPDEEGPLQRRKVEPPSNGSPTNLNTPSPPGGKPPRRRVIYPVAAPVSPTSLSIPIAQRILTPRRELTYRSQRTAVLRSLSGKIRCATRKSISRTLSCRQWSSQIAKGSTASAVTDA